MVPHVKVRIKLNSHKSDHTLSYNKSNTERNGNVIKSLFIACKTMNFKESPKAVPHI